MGRLYQKLEENGKSDVYPYHMPGHKRNPVGNLPDCMAGMDITEIDGFDNLHDAKGILRELQEKAAKLYGAEESFYLINGSTGGILSAVSASVPVGGRILLARSCHKSAYHAAYLRRLKVSYLYPSMMEEYDICEAVTVGQVEETLEQEKDIKAVLLVSPTYEGRIADIGAIAEAAHARGVVLIVDEAHGAHLGFEEHFAPNSCKCGADIVIHSVHKTLPALTQTALLHVNGDRVDRVRLRRFLQIYQSSSPSYLLMAGIDNALDWVEREGKKQFRFFAEKYREMLQRLQDCRKLQFLSDGWEGEEAFGAGSCRQDIGKLVISGKKAELSGQEIYDILLGEYHLQPEMAAGSYCLAMFTVGDGREAYERMTKALLELDLRISLGEWAGRSVQVELPKGADRDRFTGIPLCQAWDMETELIPLKKAVGRISGEFVNLYPPGVPIVTPGEAFGEEICLLIEDYLSKGLNVQGVTALQGIARVRVLTSIKNSKGKDSII